MRRRTFLAFVLYVVCLLPLSCADGREIRLLYVNDFHGFALGYPSRDGSGEKGGIARLAGLVDKLRQEKPSLLLAAGDMIQGDAWANLFQGEPAIKAMNAMRFDAMVLGNHEFDFGSLLLKKRIGEARFPVLAANVQGLTGVKPYVLKDLNGLKVAIIGVVTEETRICTHPKNVESILFEPHKAAAERWVGKLREKADLVIVLSHIGYHGDVALAETVRGIDVIVGGHTHTKLEKPVLIGGTVVVQAWQHGLALGVLDLSVEDGKVVNLSGRLHDVGPGLPENGEVRRIVDEYARRIEERLGEIVGEAAVDFDGAGVRKEETNLGNLVADVVREASGADVALFNGGGIRVGIRKGPIRMSDIYRALPFDNYVVAVRLTGGQVRACLEHGVSDLEERGGKFPQISGLAFTFNPSDPVGRRVKSVTFKGSPIDEHRHYTVATNDFLALGGDGYNEFREVLRQSKGFSVEGGMVTGEAVVFSDPGTWIRDLVASHIRSKGIVTGAKEGRIVRVTGG